MNIVTSDGQTHLMRAENSPWKVYFKGLFSTFLWKKDIFKAAVNTVF